MNLKPNPAPKAPSTILACTDGSAYAPSVYDHAAWAARRLDAPVHVLHLVDPHHETATSADYTGAIGLGAKSALMEELVALEAAKARIAHARGRAILEDATARLAAAGLTRITADQKHGSLADSLDTFEPDAALIVLGKRGETASRDFKHLGSNLERVIRSARHPVLVASRAFQPIERVLFACDGGPSAQKAVAYAAESPLLRGLHCHLLTVGPPDAAKDAGLFAARDRLAAAGLSVHADHLPGHADEVIAEAVKRENIHLLVMGAYGHSRIRQLIVGSTTTTMVRTCQVPVLLFR